MPHFFHDLNVNMYIFCTNIYDAFDMLFLKISGQLAPLFNQLSPLSETTCHPSKKIFPILPIVKCGRLT